MKQEKNSKTAFSLSLIAGILIVCNAALVGVVATWFPTIFPTIPGTGGNSAVPFASITAVGLLCGTVVLVGSLLLRSKPINKKVWGIMIAAFSIPSVIIGGGFIVGFILGIIGGALAFTWKPQTQATEPKWRSFLNSDRLKEAEGAGPKIMAPLFVTLVATALISYAYRPSFNYPLMAAEWRLALGVLFLVVGFPFWITAVGLFLRALSRGQLETHGPFAVMPNPIYGSFVTFIIPGISLLLGWWPILLTSVAMYIALRVFIHEEDDSLREKFGTQYDDYRKKVLIKFL